MAPSSRQLHTSTVEVKKRNSNRNYGFLYVTSQFLWLLMRFSVTFTFVSWLAIFLFLQFLSLRQKFQIKRYTLYCYFPLDSFGLVFFFSTLIGFLFPTYQMERMETKLGKMANMANDSSFEIGNWKDKNKNRKQRNKKRNWHARYLLIAEMLHGKLKKCVLGICDWCGLHCTQCRKLLLIILFVLVHQQMAIFDAIFVMTVRLYGWHGMLLRRWSRRMMRFSMRWLLWYIALRLQWMLAIVFDVTGNNFIDTVMTMTLLMVTIIHCRRTRRFYSTAVNLRFKPFDWNIQSLRSRSGSGR